MGEIRSTLDIIMEKTKGLTMSEEEKRALKEQEMGGKVRGLLEKHLDGIFDMEKLKIEVAALAEKDKDMVRMVIRRESISRIEIGEDNEPVLRILEESAGLDTKSIREILKDFEDRLGREKGARKTGLQEKLKERGISGTAVIANIKSDPEWNKYLAVLKKGLQDQLSLLSGGVENS